MDALALLCNLHADGPLTLQRLRRVGCETISQLVELDAARLAIEIEADEASALRFQREGELLGQRVDVEQPRRALSLPGAPGATGARDRTESRSSEQACAPPERIETTGDAEGADDRPAPTEDLIRSAESGPLSGATRPEFGRVLATWRSLDDQAPPTAPTDFLVPQPPPDPLDNRALEDAAIDGLSLDLVHRLAELGILSLRGLMNASTLELAREVGLPFTRVHRLQFLAGRAMETMREELEAEQEQEGDEELAEEHEAVPEAFSEASTSPPSPPGALSTPHAVLDVGLSSSPDPDHSSGPFA